MRQILPPPWVRRFALTLLAFAGLIVAAPGSARAGCSHALASQAHFDVLLHAGAMDEVPPPSHVPLPCSGPSCSKAPAVPPAAASGFVSSEPWAVLAVGMILVPEASSDFVRETPRDAGERFGPSIFHPPR